MLQNWENNKRNVHLKHYVTESSEWGYQVEVRSLVMNIRLTHLRDWTLSSDGLLLSSRISRDWNTSEALPITPHSSRFVVANDQLCHIRASSTGDFCMFNSYGQTIDYDYVDSFFD